MSIVLSGLLGAFFASIISFLFNMWKMHRDERNSRCDELCSTIRHSAELASKYWSVHYDTKENSDRVVCESELRSAQILIDGLYEEFRHFVPNESAEKIDYSLSEMLDAFTGGNFSVRGRKIDLERIVSSQQTASNSIVLIRRFHSETLPFINFTKNYHNNRNRKIDMPSAHVG